MYTHEDFEGLLHPSDLVEKLVVTKKYVSVSVYACDISNNSSRGYWYDGESILYNKDCQKSIA